MFFNSLFCLFLNRPVKSGGVVILMLFAVMLTGGKDFVSRAQNLLGLTPMMGSVSSYIAGAFVALVFLLINIKLLTSFFSLSENSNDGRFSSTVNQLGHLLVKEHVLAFEISSVLLLGALVGAAIIARPKKH
jgi:NADH-quinone oxidoreductase subunit J